VHGVVRRGGAHDAPAPAAHAERQRAGGRPAAREDPGADARVGQQPGERLAVGDDVGVGDDRAAGPGELRDRAQVAVDARGPAYLRRARGGGAHVVLPRGPRDDVHVADAEAHELAEQAREERARAVPRQQRGRTAACGGRGRQQHHDRRPGDGASGGGGRGALGVCPRVAQAARQGAGA
jgi:hypothetical protein